jgi:glycosyltransferase involved in cell wall biosynthesis
MSRPRISVVIATYRRPDILCRAVESVLTQDFEDFEILIVDDNGLGSDMQGATERTIHEKYPDERIIYIANEKRLGGGGARNVGISRARGEFVAFLDDDEDWLPGKLTRQVKVLSEASEDTGVVDTGFYSVSPKGDRIYHSPEMQGWIFEELLAKTDKRAPKLSTILCRKTVLEKAGLFDPALRSRQDLDLYIRLSQVCRFVSIDEPLANKRYDAGTRISDDVDAKLQGYQRVYEKNIDAFMKRPSVHADYLINYSLVFIRSKNYISASGKILKAFYIVKFNPARVVSYTKRVTAPFFSR